MRSLNKSLQAFLATNLKADLPFKFVSLWRRWNIIVGQEVGELAQPLKRAKKTLLLGCEDTMSMQEATYYRDWILQEVNAYLECNYFEKVQFELLQGRKPLSECYGHLGVGQEKIKASPLPVPAPGLGTLEKVPKEETPEGRAYRSYLKIFGL